MNKPASDRQGQGPGDDAHRMMLREAYLLMQRRQFRAAEGRCRALLAQAPANSEALELLGDLRHRQRDAEDALSWYRRALNAGSDRPQLRAKHDAILNADRRPWLEKRAEQQMRTHDWLDRYRPHAAVAAVVALGLFGWLGRSQAAHPGSEFVAMLRVALFIFGGAAALWALGLRRY